MSAGQQPCTCGHSKEEHGHDPKFPGSTACSECECIAYEADEDDGDPNISDGMWPNVD